MATVWRITVEHDNLSGGGWQCGMQYPGGQHTPGYWDTSPIPLDTDLSMGLGTIRFRRRSCGGIQVTRWSSRGNVNFQTTIGDGTFIVSCGGVHPDIPDDAPPRNPWETFGDYCRRVSTELDEHGGS